MAEAESPPSTPPPTLRRRNSIGTPVIPTKLSLPSKPFHFSSLPIGNGAVSSSPADLELGHLAASFKSSSSSYTSLKDILPSTAVNSPTVAPSGGGSAYEISIRNHLVKQAAWAYLQPMSSSPDSSGQHFFRRLWLGLSTRNPIAACIRFINLHVIPGITRAFDRIVRAIQTRLHR